MSVQRNGQQPLVVWEAARWGEVAGVRWADR